MKKHNLKSSILIIILSLFFTGLIICGVFYFLDPDANNRQKNIHSSNLMEAEFFETAFKFRKQAIDLSKQDVAAGIIPHHLLAADLIAEFFYNLRIKDYETIILIGPNHFNNGKSDMIVSGYDWQTPYGVLECDQELLAELLNFKDIKVEEEAIKGEHSINSETPFIKKIFPKVKFVPIILKSGVNMRQAEELAETLFNISRNKKVLVLGSVDFSHYKDSATAQINDKVSIETMQGFNFDEIYDLDVDSPASIYTLLKFSRMDGNNFKLLNNSNSALLVNKLDLDETTSYVTGYFGKPFASNLPLSKNIAKPLSMLFLGDLMLDRTIKEQISIRGPDYLFTKLAEQKFFDGYDLIGANLEGTVTENGEYDEPVKEYDFAFDLERLDDLKKYNFNFFTLANNHFDDQGEKGVEDTRKYLNEAGFYYVGCEKGRVDDCSIKTIQSGGKKIGMVGLNSLYNFFDSKGSLELINNLKKKVDLVVVNIHWGEEYQIQFNDSQQRLARQFIDAGADVIIGHHPHVVEGMEIYKNKPIFYSLGNFIFDQYFSEETQRGLGVSLILENSKTVFMLYPFKASFNGLELMVGSEKEEFLKSITDRSVIDENTGNEIRRGIFVLYN